ncbi:MAG TPA: HD-GYP domain-containing protein [Gammaproteobacteria bacterium]
MKKIEIWDLKVGMYIRELDRPWLETPFLLQGLWINSPGDLEEVKRYCKYVYIDPDKGRDVDDSDLALDGSDTYVTQTGGQKPIKVEKPPAYKVHVRFEKEIDVAKNIHKQAAHVVRNMYDDVRMGKSINTEGAKATVSSIVDSIIRNPDAQVWLTQLKDKDEYTAIHSLNVCILSLAFGRHLGFSREMLNELGLGALLHDLGKIRVPGQVLNKPGKLTDDEFKLMKLHPVYGKQILSITNGLSPNIIDIAYSHHERMNGTGYPHGLNSDQISLYGRMVAIVDIYDAITSQRVYHHGVHSMDAMKQLYELRRTDLDNKMVEQFIQCLGIYPVGSVVELACGAIGIVISINRERRLKPKILLVMNEKKEFITPTRIIDLAKFDSSKFGTQFDVKNVVQASVYRINILDYITPRSAIDQSVA